MKIRTMLLAICTAMASNSALSEVGCLDTSMHLKERFDSKATHLVQCNCDCRYHQAKGKKGPRNQCIECMHFHDARPWIILQKLAHASTSRINIPEDPKRALQRLIQRFRLSKTDKGF